MLKLDLSNAQGFLPQDWLDRRLPALEQAHRQVLEGNGPGGDFTGWVTLPRDYDSAELVRIKAAAEKIRSYIKKARGRRRTALETCTAADLAQLDSGAMPVNMDKYLTLRYPEPATILDYFDDPLLILEEPASLREAERATAFRRGEELSALLEDGVLAAGLDKLYAESGWLWAQCAAHRTLCAENFARSMPDVPLKTIVNAPAHTLPAWGGEVAALLEDIQPLCSGGTAVTVMAGTPRAAA